MSKTEHLRLIAGCAREDVHAERFKGADGRWGFRPVEALLTDDRLRSHLDGGPPLGVYLIPSGTDHTCLAVFDLDDHDGVVEWSVISDAANRIVDTARRFGLNAWIVLSGGGRGIHIWFWWDEPQCAASVRRMMQTVLAAAGFTEGDGGVASGEIEIFPKQDRVATGDYGSLVALPFARQSVPLGADLKPTDEPALWYSSSRVVAPPADDGCDADEPSICEALKHITADDYGRWISVGLALKHDLGEDGLAIWDGWSQGSEKYPGSGALAQRWRTFKQRSDGVTCASIFHWAREAGWNGPISPRLPVVQIRPGELSRVVDEAEAALVASDCGLYRHGGRIVRVVWDRMKTPDEGEATAPRLHEAVAAHMTERFAKAARFEKFGGSGSRRPVRCDVPELIGKAYLARGEWRLPPLLGVITAPTLRPDGSVLDRPGYDEATGLMFDPLGVDFPPVPQQPTRSEAKEALATIGDLLKEFPFVADADRSVVLSGIITAVIRRALPTAPMHAFDAPVAGTGKSYLINLIATIATGSSAAVSSTGRDRFGDAELEKRLTASMLGGDAVISLDNMKHPLGGELLCQLLTERIVKLRPLGHSVNVEVPNTTMFFANGNNLEIADDMTRRVILCTMDSGCERPELREFKTDPLGIVRRDRGRYVVAALTVVRAYLCAGSPKQSSPLGSYEMWSARVRDPLLWLGEADPVETMEKVRGSDPVLAATRQVIAEWEAVIGLDKRVLVRDVIAAATKRDLMPGPDDDCFVNPGLREALLAVARGNVGEINPDRLGKWLRSVKRRTVDKRRFVDDGSAHNALMWRLENSEGPRQGALELG